MSYYGDIWRNQWVEVPCDKLQRWLDTTAPDYTLHHQWGDDEMVCVARRGGYIFAREAGDICFVRGDFALDVE